MRIKISFKALAKVEIEGQKTARIRKGVLLPLVRAMPAMQWVQGIII